MDSSSGHVPIIFCWELGQACVPFGLHGGDGGVPASAVEDSLLSGILLIEFTLLSKLFS